MVGLLRSDWEEVKADMGDAHWSVLYGATEMQAKDVMKIAGLTGEETLDIIHAALLGSYIAGWRHKFKGVKIR